MARASKIENLNCGAHASEGARLVLEARLAEMCALNRAAIEWSDSEGVHNMRVASRRLRSAMGDFRIFFRKRQFENLRARVKSVADALGKVRDKDVAIIALDELAKESPMEARRGIEMIAGYARARREMSRAELVIAIVGISDLRLPNADSKSKGGNRKSETESGELSFREMGREVIGRRLGKLEKSCRSLLRPFDIDSLHRTRIEAKRLRYALELYEVCWGDELLSSAEQVAKMQSSLGDLHDCDVWIDDLGAKLSGELSASPGDAKNENANDGDETRRAAIWLLSYFAKARTKHYRAALELWHDWETKDFFGRLREMLNHEPPPVETSSATTKSNVRISGKLSPPSTIKRKARTRATSVKKRGAKRVV